MAINYKITYYKKLQINLWFFQGIQKRKMGKGKEDSMVK